MSLRELIHASPPEEHLARGENQAMVGINATPVCSPQRSLPGFKEEVLRFTLDAEVMRAGARWL